VLPSCLLRAGWRDGDPEGNSIDRKSSGLPWTRFLDQRRSQVISRETVSIFLILLQNFRSNKDLHNISHTMQRERWFWCICLPSYLAGTSSWDGIPPLLVSHNETSSPQNNLSSTSDNVLAIG